MSVQSPNKPIGKKPPTVSDELWPRYGGNFAPCDLANREVGFFPEKGHIRNLIAIQNDLTCMTARKSFDLLGHAPFCSVDLIQEWRNDADTQWSGHFRC